ncbi:MAG TPA: ABC transporter ATP-binding protein [Gemmatimonadales bacterium]|nr:ABC transporter ATP-binding protein [Gemmatimonadales bacterium]
MDDTTVAVEHVSKKFRRGELHDSLRDLVPALVRRAVRRTGRPELAAREFWALDDVSFTVGRGEALGVVGGNGAGKSTLLKLLGRILRPTRGAVRIHGRLSALIEVSAGFHPDLTGRENVYLYGTILGMSRQDIRRRFDAIVGFSGLEEFMDTPVKRYSSGMFARLGFSVAAHVDPDVLLVDEVLSVGDLVFQRRCMERMREVIRQGTTVLFVSHNLRAVNDLCSRALLLDHGRVTAAGAPAEVTQAYLLASLAGRRDVDGRDAHIARITVRGADGPRTLFQAGERAWVDVELAARTACERLSVSLVVQDGNAQQVFDTSTERLGQRPIDLQAGGIFRCSVQLDLHLAPGTFHLGAILKRYDIEREYDRWAPAASIVIESDRDVRGVANLYPRVVAFEPGPASPGSGRP